jgi:peptidoglycan/LPS O-acetylase OafA/YrhL
MGLPTAAPTRLGSIDNLRVFLTALVVVHHAGQAYGLGGWWYYEEPQRTAYLGAFFTVNASFFMGLYFLVSAYFTPGSFDRKGPAAFIWDRLIRLGVPLAVFFLGIIPVLTYAYYLNIRPYGPIGFVDYYTQVYFGQGPRPSGWSGPTWPDMQFGHLWFVQHLLCYTLLYLVWRQSPDRVRRRVVGWLPGEIRHRHLVVFALLLAAATFIVRIWYPIDWWVGILGFIQSEPAHLPQYASLYVLGLAAAGKGWLKSMPTSLGRTWLVVALTLAAIMWLGLVPGFGWLWPYFAGGGLSEYAAVRATWEAFLCVGMCVGLVVFFRDHVAARTPILKSLAADTYGVYLFHVPVLVVLSYALSGAALSPLVKFLLGAVFGLAFTVALVEPLRRLPGVKRVL